MKERAEKKIEENKRTKRWQQRKDTQISVTACANETAKRKTHRKARGQ